MTKRIIDRIIFNLIERYPSFSEQFVGHFLQRRYEIPVNPGHYYSPLPDIPALKKGLSRWNKKSAFKGVDLNPDKQVNLLQKLEKYSEECEHLPDFDKVTADGYGQGYGEVEAHLLHCMIRHFRPRRVIEVGSGVSSYFTLNALQKNREEDNSSVEFICIEPYPTLKLRELANTNKILLYDKQVQDVDVEIFARLSENDLLFIDSTHISKVDSDVNFLYLEVLPIIAKGALIHIHDIPFPYLTLMPDHPLFSLSLLWNEAPLVKAFLLFNQVFEILMCQSYLHFEFPESIKKVISIYDPQKHFPASLWLQRKE